LAARNRLNASCTSAAVQDLAAVFPADGFLGAAEAADLTTFFRPGFAATLSQAILAGFAAMDFAGREGRRMLLAMIEV
jgi:hypothetical protein